MNYKYIILLKRGNEMKKPAFVITEIFLSLVLVASVASAAVLTADIRSGGTILPQKYFTTLGKTSQNEASSEKVSAAPTESKTESTSESSVQSVAESSDEKPEQSSQASEESKESEPEESKQSALEALSLQLEEPSDLKDQPEELTKLVKSYGYDYETLGFDKLIVVDKSEASTANVYCYQKSSKGYWWDIAGTGKPLTDKGFIGQEGVDFNVKPGSKQTPLGFYPITEGFYIDNKPETTFPMFKITEDTYWVTDPKSEYYNQRVEGTDKKDWSSAEHMISSPDSYSCGLVIDFNTYKPADKSLTGGIFVHVGDAPTEGCVVMPETQMRAIIEWLDGDNSCYIFIT